MSRTRAIPVATGVMLPSSLIRWEYSQEVWDCRLWRRPVALLVPAQTVDGLVLLTSKAFESKLR